MCRLSKESAKHHCRENCPKIRKTSLSGKLPKNANSGNRENCPKKPQDIIVGKTAQKRLIPGIAFSSIYAWLPQASYPCGNFSDTCSWTPFQPKGSIGHAFTVCLHTENQNQARFSPVSRHEVSVLIELTLGHLRCRLTDVPSAQKIRKTSLSGKLPKKSAKHHCRENCPKTANSGNRIFLDLPRSSSVFLDLPRSFLDLPRSFPRSSSIFLDLPRSSSIFLDLPRSPSIFLDLPRSSSIFLDLPRSSSIFLDLPRSFLDLPRSWNPHSKSAIDGCSIRKAHFSIRKVHV